jgi:hypothetical protein
MIPRDGNDGSLDLADIEVIQWPEGWSPDVTEDSPNEGDVRDLDEDADE